MILLAGLNFVFSGLNRSFFASMQTHFCQSPSVSLVLSLGHPGPSFFRRHPLLLTWKRHRLDAAHSLHMARLTVVATLHLAIVALLATTATATSRHHARSSPRHTPACRRSQHVVYTSFERPELYMHVASYHTMRAVAGKAQVHHLNIFNTGTEYHNSSIAEVHPNLHNATGVHRHDIDLNKTTGFADLNRHYLHSSVNGRDYEMLCMARFLVLRNFCKDSGIDVFTHLDGDIAVFDGTFLDSVCIPANHTSWFYSQGSTFLSTVSCRDVGEFADFLLRFYMRANRTDLVADIVKHGTPDPVSDYWSAMLHLQVPEYAETRLAPHHISDMYLLIAFFTATHVGGRAHHPPHPYIYRHAHPGVDDLTPVDNLRAAVPVPNLCDDAAVFDAHVRLSETEQLYRVGESWHKLRGVHFQGAECKAHLVRTLGKPVLALAKGEAV